MLILLSASLPNMIVANGLGIILAICKPHYGVTAIKVPLQKCYHRHPPSSLPAPLQATLPANELPTNARLLLFMIISLMTWRRSRQIYGVIKEKAEQKMTLPTPLRSHCHQGTDTKIATIPAPFNLSVVTFTSNLARHSTR